MIGTVFGGIVGLTLAIAGVLLFIWLLWRLWTGHAEEQKGPAVTLEAAPRSSTAETPIVEVTIEEPAPVVEPELAGPQEQAVVDDLKRIEGIGPKIAGVLQARGLTTFAQLADADASHLQHILEQADPRLLRLADPTSWPEQAALAAAGEWEALEALQSELKGGQRR